MTEESSAAGALRDFLRIVFKHKGKILTIFLATVGTVTLVSFALPPIYEAKATVLVKMGREYVTQAGVGDVRSIMALNQEDIVNSEIQILNNRALIERVVSTLGVDVVYPKIAANPPRGMTSLGAATLKFEKDLSVEAVRKSSVIAVAFEHSEPSIAAQAVNLLLEFFKEKHLEVFANPQSSFLERQLAEYEQLLKESENALEAYQQKHQVYSLSEQRTLLLGQRMELDTTLKKTRNSIEELQKKVASFRDQLQEISTKRTRYTQTERDRIIVEAQNKLLTLQLKEQQLLAKFKQENALVQDVRQEIRVVKGFLDAQEDDIQRKVRTGNPVYQGVEKELLLAETELRSQLAKAAVLLQQTTQLDREIQAVSLLEKDLQGLNRDLATKEKNYRTYLERLEEARISDDMNRQKIANISVIQPATVPLKPVKPKKLLNIALGVLVGALGGLAVAFIAELLRQGVSTPAQVQEHLGLPVLATLSLRKDRTGAVPGRA